MPNWCENDLTIQGPEEEIAKLIEFVKTDKRSFDFNKIIPYPEKYKRVDDYEFVVIAGFLKDGYNCGGYDWCNANWDTKWNATEAYMTSHPPTCIEYSFETAWSPPLKIIKKLASIFPKLTFHLEYYEGGAGYCGILKIENNAIIEDTTSKYSGDRGG